MRNRVTAILFCVFFFSFGGHKFYLGQIGTGIIFLIFSWTFIPSLLSFIDLIKLVLMSDIEFDRQFNKGTSQATLSARESTAALIDLKRLYDEGVLTAEEYEAKRQKLLKNI